MKGIGFTVVSFLLFGVFSITSCTKEVGPIISGGSGVYIAGYSSDPRTSFNVATCWKNNESIRLTNGSTNGRANSIFVAGPDVYIAGYDNNSAKLWKNGAPILSTYGNLNAVFVSGTDVYATGAIGNEVVYWKNGLTVSLSNGSKNEIPISIFVSGSDVYVAGQENLSPDILSKNNMGIPLAKYWRNSVSFYLTDGTRWSSTTSIIGSGSDIYIGGWELSEVITSDTIPPGVVRVAKYWKNGVPVSLSDGTENAVINSVFIDGSDVYAAGYENEYVDNLYYISNAKYWKNGVSVTLTDGTYNATALSIAVSGTDVYVSGNGKNGAVYWKNGVEVALANGTGNASAFSIFVIP